jgi:hypothetical protein
MTVTGAVSSAGEKVLGGEKTDACGAELCIDRILFHLGMPVFDGCDDIFDLISGDVGIQRQGDHARRDVLGNRKIWLGIQMSIIILEPMDRGVMYARLYAFVFEKLHKTISIYVFT